MSNYYPKQIPNLLDSNFIQYIEYNEISSDNPQVMTYYTVKNIRNIDKSINNYILPDGCIDLLIDLSTKEINFVGFSKVTHQDIINTNINYLGIRFKPGAFYNIYQVSCSEIMDQGLPFTQVDKECNINEIFNINDISKQILYLETYLNTKNNKISKYQTLVDEIYKLDQIISVKEISNLLNYSCSHTNRLFKRHFGYNIKTLLNIVRLHKTLELLIDTNESLNNITYYLDYYDLAHLSNEIIKYTKKRPHQFFK